MEINTRGVTKDIGVRCAENKFPWPPKLIKGKNSAIKQEISIEKLCVSSICSLPGISGIIIGSTSLTNIENNINYTKSKLPSKIISELLDKNSEYDAMTNPRNWWDEYN